MIDLEELKRLAIEFHCCKGRETASPYDRSDEMAAYDAMARKLAAALPGIVAKLEAAESSLEEIAMLADHQIPAYAFGDNEAACDLASRMSSIYKLAAFDKEQS